MIREWIYLLGVTDILVGFLLFYGGSGRFGFQTCRRFLKREQVRREKQAQKVV